MLREMEAQCPVYALFAIYDANSDGDDIVIDNHRLPMLRQQKHTQTGAPNLCLADFLRPLSSGQKDRIGLFATSTDHRSEQMYPDDPAAAAEVLANMIMHRTEMICRILHEAKVLK